MELHREKIVVLIPAFNESKTVEPLIQQLTQSHYSVLVVDDGSTDDTASLAARAGAQVVQTTTNIGYENAMNFGFRTILDSVVTFVPEPQWIATMDADGQHTIEALNALADIALSHPVDLVLSVRDDKNRFSEIIFGWITHLFFRLSDPLTGLKLYRIEACKKWNYFDSKKLIGTQLAIEMAKAGHPFEECAIQILPRRDESRFAKTFWGNIKIFKALIRILKEYSWKRKSQTT